MSGADKEHTHTAVIDSSHLIEEKFSSLLFPQVHLFNRHLFAAVLFGGNAHNARGALSDLQEVVQVLARVARVHHQLQRCPELLVGHPRGRLL